MFLLFLSFMFKNNNKSYLKQIIRDIDFILDTKSQIYKLSQHFFLKKMLHVNHYIYFNTFSALVKNKQKILPRFLYSLVVVFLNFFLKLQFLSQVNIILKFK
jgi:hypothetical protein